MNSDDIKRLRALREQATQPGPWTVNVNDIGKDGDGHCVVLDAHGMWVADCGNAPADATFIAAARSALPALLDECEALRRERDEARESEGRLLARSNPLDPSGYSLADAEFILMDHHRDMSIEDRAESLKRIAETESHELRAALVSAERDWREARSTRDRLSARVAALERLLGEACDEFESAAASFADQGWPALSSEMRTRASRWRREGGIK